MQNRGKRGHLRLVEGSGRRPSVARPPTSEQGLDAESVPPSSRGRSRAALDALPDAQLVIIALDGDGGALEVLYRRHAPFAIQLATRIEGSSRDVEDVVHDAFIRAFERLGDLADPVAFRSWLGSIVVHAVRSRLRRQRLMSLLGLGRGADPVDLDSLTSPDASPHTRAQLAQIYALLRTQAANERIAWTLRCVEGHELETVAKLTDCSLATVKRRISKVQRFLESHFVGAERPLDDTLPSRVAGSPEPDLDERAGAPGAQPSDSAVASRTPRPGSLKSRTPS